MLKSWPPVSFSLVQSDPVTPPDNCQHLQDSGSALGGVVKQDEFELDRPRETPESSPLETALLVLDLIALYFPS